MTLYIILFIIQIGFAIGCIALARHRGGRPFVWLFLGLPFGPIAFLRN